MKQKLIISFPDASSKSYDWVDNPFIKSRGIIIPKRNKRNLKKWCLKLKYSKMKFDSFGLGLINGISTSYGLFNAAIWVICKCLIVIITIFSMFHCIFWKIAPVFSIIVWLYRVIWYQVFLSNTNNLHTDVWLQFFLSPTNKLYTIIWFQVTIPN